MSTASNMIENGHVYLPEKAPWLAAYIHELVTFPNGNHDDQADSTSQAINWYKNSSMPHAGIREYYREQAEKARGLSRHSDALYPGVVLIAPRLVSQSHGFVSCGEISR